MTDPKRAWLEGVSQEARRPGRKLPLSSILPSFSASPRPWGVLLNPRARHSTQSLRNRTRPRPLPQSRNPCWGPLCPGWRAGHSHLPLVSILSYEQASLFLPHFGLRCSQCLKCASLGPSLARQVTQSSAETWPAQKGLP